MRESEVAQLCPTLSDPMDCSPPGSSVQGIFQARGLQWDAIAFVTALKSSATKEELKYRRAAAHTTHQLHACVCMCVHRMDGWKEGWTDGWVGGWTDEWMDGRMDGQMDGWVGG